MTPDQAPEPRSSAPRLDARELSLDGLDDVLLDGLELDERLQSGVPESQRASDLDFIQMTGLGRPVLSQEEPMAPPPVDPNELDARRPLSFFEKGVADVDASMAPPALDAEDACVEQILPSSSFHDAPPPTVIFPETPRTPITPASESVRSTPATSSFVQEDMDSGLRQEVDGARDFLETHRESPPVVREAVPPEAPRTPIEPSSESAGSTPATSSFVRDDVDSGLRQGADGVRDFLETRRESPAAVRETVPKDDLAELSQAVERLTASPKAVPPPASATEEPKEDDWEEPVPVAGSRAEPALSPRDLAEAEQLLQELEHQPRDVMPSSPGPAATPMGEHVNHGGEDDESVYRQPRTVHRRRSGHRHTKLGRRILRWVPRVVALTLVVSGGYVAYVQVKPMFEKPTASLERARQLKDAGRYKDASDAFAQFSAGQGDQPGRAEAQFQAAYCLQLAPTQSFDEAQANKKRALQLLEQFVADNPGHAKVVRAKTRMGILHFDLEEYKEAVELLQDPSLQLMDPESALPALRTLARARMKLGDYEAAESAFSQAAALAGNYTPDQDYEELGDLNRWRAENTQGDDAARERYRTAAVENWTRAMRVPTIDPAAKAKIRTKCDWFQGQAPGLAPAGAGTPPAAAQGDVAKSEEPVVPPVEPVPQGPDPRVEAQYPGTPPANEAPPAPAPTSEEGKDDHAAPSHS